MHDRVRAPTRPGPGKWPRVSVMRPAACYRFARQRRCLPLRLERAELCSTAGFARSTRRRTQSDRGAPWRTTRTMAIRVGHPRMSGRRSLRRRPTSADRRAGCIASVRRRGSTQARARDCSPIRTPGFVIGQAPLEFPSATGSSSDNARASNRSRRDPPIRCCRKRPGRSWRSRAGCGRKALMSAAGPTSDVATAACRI